MSDEKKLYGDFEIVAKDKDGNVIQTNTVKDSGSFTVEELWQNAMLHGLDQLEITPIGFETREGDNTQIRVGADS